MGPDKCEHTISIVAFLHWIGQKIMYKNTIALAFKLFTMELNVLFWTLINTTLSV